MVVGWFFFKCDGTKKERFDHLTKPLIAFRPDSCPGLESQESHSVRGIDWFAASKSVILVRESANHSPIQGLVHVAFW